MDTQRMPVDDYADLYGAIGKFKEENPGMDVLIFPDEGAAALEERLTCVQCGRFVCYRHDPSVKPKYKEETTQILHPKGSWSKPFPVRIAQMIMDRLELTIVNANTDTAE